MFLLTSSSVRAWDRCCNQAWLSKELPRMRNV